MFLSAAVQASWSLISFWTSSDKLSHRLCCQMVILITRGGTAGDGKGLGSVGLAVVLQNAIQYIATVHTPPRLQPHRAG